MCIYITDGNLDTCSLGIWGNGYTDKNFDEEEADLYGDETKEDF